MNMRRTVIPNTGEYPFTRKEASNIQNLNLITSAIV